MTTTDLEGITTAVIHRAKSNGFVLAREIKEELGQAGLDEKKWKDVVKHAGTRLSLRKSRYHYVSSLTARMREDVNHRKRIHQAVGQLIRAYKIKAIETERRQNKRIHYIQPVLILTDKGKECQAMSHDISLTGIRLVVSKDFQGQRLRIVIPRSDRGTGQFSFLVQLLWSMKAGDGLFECGGIFLQMTDEST